jgi:hypothetical protein
MCKFLFSFKCKPFNYFGTGSPDRKSLCKLSLKFQLEYHQGSITSTFYSKLVLFCICQSYNLILKECRLLFFLLIPNSKINIINYRFGLVRFGLIFWHPQFCSVRFGLLCSNFMLGSIR